MSGRYATRHNHRDANEGQLVLAAEQIGAGWIEAGPLDGWTVHKGVWVPVEIKNPQGRNRYQRGQAEFITLCGRIGAPVFTWRTVDDVISTLQGIGTVGVKR
jgi:hypothetical protein